MKRRRDQFEQSAEIPPPPQPPQMVVEEEEVFGVLGVYSAGLVPGPPSPFSSIDISPWTHLEFNFAVADAQLRAVVQQERDLSALLGPAQQAWAGAPQSAVAYARVAHIVRALAHARAQKEQYIASLESLARYLMTKRPAEGLDRVIAIIQETLA